MSDTMVTLVGHLVAEPELRFVKNGSAVASFTVAHTARKYEKDTDKWVDGDTLFMKCSVWRDAAENVAESLGKGARVIVHGKLKPRSWDDKEGNKRSSIELDVDEVGPSLRYAQARVSKVDKSARITPQPAADPWGSNEQAPF